jgi:hypothetical protein
MTVEPRSAGDADKPGGRVYKHEDHIHVSHEGSFVSTEVSYYRTGPTEFTKVWDDYEGYDALSL